MQLKKQKGFALITLIIAMVLMAALGAGIYSLTTSSTFSELLASRDYNAYQLAKAGLRYAAFNSASSPEGTYCMSGGQCFTITLDTSDPTVKKFTAVGKVNQGTFLAANRQLAYNMPTSPGKSTISFADDMGDIPQPNVGWGMNKTGAVTVDYTNKQILLGDGTPTTTDSFGSVVYGGGSYLGNCSYGICDFGAGIHAYYEFTFFPEDSSANSALSADGFTFALFNGTNNLITATGGPPPDVASLGELVGYAGPGTRVGTEGPGWQPPKFAIEFDSYPNTGDFSITVPGSRRDPIPFRDHMALILWGENNADPYRTDATLANAVGLRCARNDEFARSLYRSVLGRHAELGGLQAWTDGLNAQTTTVTQNAARDNMIRGFFGSAEYTGKNTNDVQYVKDVSRAVLGVIAPTVTPTCPAGKFYAEYFNNATLSGTPVFTQCEDAPIPYDWGTSGPAAGIGTDNFSVRWSGQFMFAGSTTFTARADDGVRVSVDGNWIINAWVDQAPTTYTATRSLDAGFHPVVMEYYERGGGAVAQLSWSTISRDAFLEAVLASPQYKNNIVASCGTYISSAPMGMYNCGGVSRVSTSLDCSGLPLSLYNRDTLDDNVHSEGETESSFTALPLSPHNSGVGTGYHVIPDTTCKSSSSTCRGFEDGYLHKFRIEVLRDTVAHPCNRDYTGSTVPPATPGPGNCYNYQVKAWMDCDGSNPTGCTATQLNKMKDVNVAFTDSPPQIDRIIELTEYWHTRFNKMIFGWTGATGQPVGGTGQKVSLSNFELFFRTPQPCPPVTSITPVSAALPSGTAGTAYGPQTLAAAPLSAKPFKWFVISGSLPAGLSLSPAGVISGTPTYGGISNFTVRATNSCDSSLTKAYNITVSGPTCSGGTTTSAGGKWVHTFTSSGTLSCPAAVTADVLIVAGGGGGGTEHAGGGGAGGLLAVNTLAVSAQTYPVVVGSGGVVAGNGGNSSAFGYTAIGGGRGGSTWGALPAIGGSGGGGDYNHTGGAAGTPGQGYAGAATTATYNGGGGGGAGANASGITGGAYRSTWAGGFAGGGGGGYAGGAGGGAGAGKGGLGAAAGGNATANTGSGGGGGGNLGAAGGAGGSGIVIIRY